METKYIFSILKLFVIILILEQNAECAPTANQTQALFYLSQFGYLPSSTKNLQSGAIMDEDTWNNAITEFQLFAGLNVTGVLDKDTIDTMKLPRCGVRDKVGSGTDSRSKRYALQGSRWKVKHLTYRIHNYPKQLQKDKVDDEIARALGVWSGYTDLTFEQKRKGQVHIDISFERGEHGDGDPFDGPGGTLAHAYFPVFGGDAHFDADEHWTIDSFRGTNLFQVAAHEFGHSLGLSHSDVKSALMAPFYRGYNPAFRLDQDDVDGIQALYGKRTNNDVGGTKGGSKPADTPSTHDDPVLCGDPSFDTIFTTPDGSTFVFKGDKYWKLTDDSIASGYPKYISKGWPGLPGNIDAAFSYKNGKTYFFKGKQYWRYVGRKVDGDYPKDISEGFTGIPDNVDAAMVWSGNGKIYFFKGSKFWRFDPSQRPPVKSTYPKLLSNWDGVPDNLDDAFQYTNGFTYFFKKGTYYRFNDRAFSVERVDPKFPRSTAWWWFGCKNAPKGTVGNELSRVSESEKVAEKDRPLSQHDDVGEFAFDAAEVGADSQDDFRFRTASYDLSTLAYHSGALQAAAPLIILIMTTLAAIFVNS